MKVKYEVEVEEDEYWGEEDAVLVRVDPDGTRTQIGWYGGEPEDNTHYRTYFWVVDAVNDAYKLGLEHGKGGVN